MIIRPILAVVVIFICFIYTGVNAQNIGINSNGATPNASAMLDIDVNGLTTKKGLLIPRVTQAQKTAMNPLPSPAQGLLVYQTDGLQGFYYNTSTTTTPAWEFLLNTSFLSSSWSLSGNSSIAAGSYMGTSDNNDVVFKANSTEIMRISAPGMNLGIGATPTSLARLHVESDIHQYGMYLKKTNTGGSDSYGLYVEDMTYGSNSYGIQSYVLGNPGTAAYGMDVRVQTVSNYQYAIKTNKIGTAYNSSYGLFMEDMTGTQNRYGIQLNNSGNAFNTVGIELNETSTGSDFLGYHLYNTGSFNTAQSMRIDDNSSTPSKTGIRTVLAGTANNEAIGLDVSILNNAQDRYGLKTTSSGVGGNNSYGIQVNENGGALSVYGIQANMNGGGFMSTGLSIQDNSGAASKNGIDIRMNGSGGSAAYGAFIGNYVSATDKFGYAAHLTGNGANSYGLHIQNNSTAASNYGVYVQSTGYAGYFIGTKSYFNGYVGINEQNPAAMLDVQGSVKIGNYFLPTSDGSPGQVMKTDGSGTVSWASPASSGVTSVGLSMPGIFGVTGSPVTSTGTLNAFLMDQAANTVFAGPTSGGVSTPSFRTLVAADLPDLSSGYIKNQAVNNILGTGQTASFDINGNAEIGGNLKAGGIATIGTVIAEPTSKLTISGGNITLDDTYGLKNLVGLGSHWTIRGFNGNISIGETPGASYHQRTNIFVPNNGVYIGNDLIAPGIYVNLSSQVSINTAIPNPASKLHVDGNIFLQNTYSLLSSNGLTNYSILSNNNGLLTIGDYTSTAHDRTTLHIPPSGILFNYGGSTTSLYLNQSGQVSINAPSINASSKLHIGGNVFIDGTYGILSNYGSGQFYLMRSTAGDFRIGDRTVGNLAKTTIEVPSNGVFFETAPNTNAISVTSSGNVGIGPNTSGIYRLEVDGQVKITGGFPGAGKVLTSDASGAASWQTPTAIPSAWELNGNIGTNSATNFIGTTDNQDVVFKRQMVPALRLAAGGAILAVGDPTTGITPVSGAGWRMMWIPAKAAFRAGQASSTEWNDANVGMNSMALGAYVQASGTNAMAFGTTSSATGLSAITLGTDATASGPNSTAIGEKITVSGTNSIAIGHGASFAAPLTNAIDNTLMVGFNSNVPTLFVGASSGAGTTGNVGIGNSSPTYKLDVTGAGRFTSSLRVGAYLLPPTDGTNGQVLKTDGSGILSWQSDNTGTNGWTLSGNAATSAATNFIGTTDAVDFVTRTNNLERMRITSAGNVGIGNAGPSYKLDVTGTGRYTSTLTVGAYTLPATDGTNGQVLKTNGTGTLTWQADNTAAGWTLTGNAGTTAGTNFIGTTDAVDFIAKTNNTERLRITASGDLGIGVTPSYKLHASGTVYAQGGGYKINTTTMDLYRSNNGLYGSASSFDFNTVSTNNGIILEQGENESGGFYADGDMAGIWSPGDNDIIKFWDEDAMTLRARLDGTGNWYAVSNNATSDARMKKNIRPLYNSLDKILMLDGKIYDWREEIMFKGEIEAGKPVPTDELKNKIGFIAQDVEKVIPEVVVTNKATGMKAINYDGILPVVVEAMKEMNSKIEELKSENEALKAKLEALEKSTKKD